eukprot:gene33301-41095_t
MYSKEIVRQDTTGPLSVVAIDTGGGIHVLQPFGVGVKVANVLNDTEYLGPNVKPRPFLDVSSTAESALIDDGQLDFTIYGTGFNPNGNNRVIFSNPVEFSVIDSSETHIHLQLAK